MTSLSPVPDSTTLQTNNIMDLLIGVGTVVLTLTKVPHLRRLWHASAFRLLQDRKRVRLCGQTFRTTEKRIARKGLREIFADNRQAICRDETAARSKNEKRKIRRFPPNITLLTKKINVRILTKQVLARIRALRIIAFRSVTEGYNNPDGGDTFVNIIAFRSVTAG